jgi:hypothetical protein
MRHRWLAATAALLLLATIVQFATAHAAGAAVTIERVPVSFVLTPEQCPDIQSTISGESEYFVRAKERTDRNGVTHIFTNVTARGTATDEAGNEYSFNYHNVSSADVPPGGFPRVEHVTDSFNLVGHNGLNHLHVSFVIDVTFAEEGAEPTVDEISITGTPSCDPI